LVREFGPQIADPTPWMKGVLTFHIPVLVGSVVLFGYCMVGIFRGLGPKGQY